MKTAIRIFLLFLSVNIVAAAQTPKPGDQPAPLKTLAPGQDLPLVDPEPDHLDALRQEISKCMAQKTASQLQAQNADAELQWAQAEFVKAVGKIQARGKTDYGIDFSYDANAGKVGAFHQIAKPAEAAKPAPTDVKK